MSRRRGAVPFLLLSLLVVASTAMAALIVACSTFGDDNRPDAADAASATDASTDDDKEAAADADADPGCSVVTVTSHAFAAQDSGTITAVVSDGTNVFWASGSTISRAPIAVSTNVARYVEVGSVQQLVLTKGYVIARVGSAAWGRPSASLVGPSTEYELGWGRIDGDSQSVSFVGAKGGDLVQIQLPAGASSTLDTGYTSIEATATSAGRTVVAGTIPPGQDIVRTYPDAGLLAVDAAPTDIATDGTTVVFADALGSVGALPFGGGPARTIAAGQSPPVVNLVVSGAYVYFASADGIRRAPLEGGCVDIVTLVPRAPFAVAGSRIFAASGSSIVELDLP